MKDYDDETEHWTVLTVDIDVRIGVVVTVSGHERLWRWDW